MLSLRYESTAQNRLFYRYLFNVIEHLIGHMSCSRQAAAEPEQQQQGCVADLDGLEDTEDADDPAVSTLMIQLNRQRDLGEGGRPGGKHPDDPAEPAVRPGGGRTIRR